MFAKGSRYEHVPEQTYVDAAGRRRPFKLLRPIPAPPALQTHTVVGGDRLDLLAAHYYADPEQYWRICDGNRALRPDDLLAETGRRLAIPVVLR
jgi:nucleoid-associated protein YgaU